MKKNFQTKEEEFIFTEVLYKLEQTCPTHNVGEKNFEKLRYQCPVCKKLLYKTKK